MLFRLTNVLVLYQVLINDTLLEYLDKMYIAYLDNILIYSKDKSKYIQDIKNILKALQSKGLKYKLSKYKFSVKETIFLGFVVLEKGLRINLKKLEVVQNQLIPTIVKGVRRFLGFANFIKKFIKDYSSIVVLLTKLIQKDIAFRQTTRVEKAFTILKEKFVTILILAHFDLEKESIVECNALDLAVSGILSQKGTDNQLYLVAFYLRKFTAAELNYNIYDKELLAIVECLQQQRVYLEGLKYTVTIYSDYKNLLYFTTTKVLNRQQV